MSHLDDLLVRSTRALRETTAPVAEGSSAPTPARASANDSEAGANVAATTLARIERSARANRVVKLRRRSYTRWIVMPMAASFVVFAAWASASGRLSGWMGVRAHEDDERATHAPHAPAAPSPPLASRSAWPAASPSTTPPLEEPLPPAASEAPSPPPSSVKKAVAPPPAAVSDALYRDAHEAHFVRRDPAAALVAWDRYLAAAGPSGRFTLEARYNRAISLVRLGRRDEAAKALRPFANGDYGGYRRDEAAQLLGTLE